ncbi:MAG TPA: diguanylate cyclase, partial [Alphaproteobacteria bacterium]
DSDRVSVSIGVSMLQPLADEGETALIAGSDEALYRAKRAGRNRVVVQEPQEKSALAGVAV